ncbi:hypothetical protein [Cellulomonas aerilata]|uniref:DUF4386 family protein n=1 Tax=Cellulomonas aerilata TaxID=515326 RepID=A0A512DBX5_9CELL|nr:hypothetical protein [Cellulomonas aerilata]GEO33984.1 hypothetical protein CAE01nite_17090 [Cellulomonas aerilata]
MSTPSRVAGWGTVGFAVAFVVTFVVNATIETMADRPELPTAADMAADFGGGVIYIVLWGSAGVALAVAAVGLSAVVWPSDALASRISTAFGIIASAGWIFSGATVLAQRTAMLNGNIAAAGSDIASERAVIEALYIGVHVGGIVFAFAALPWLATVAVGADKRRAMSRTAVACLWIAAIGPVAGFMIAGAQFGLLAVVPAFAVVGTSLLRSARRGGRRAVAGSPAAAVAPAAGG